MEACLLCSGVDRPEQDCQKIYRHRYCSLFPKRVVARFRSGFFAHVSLALAAFCKSRGKTARDLGLVLIRVRGEWMTEPYIKSSLPLHEVMELQRLMTEEIQQVALFFMNPDGVITVWNRGAEEMKGYTAKEAIGQHLSLLYTEEDRARGWPAHNLEEATKHGFFREESWRRRKDGSLFWANISLTALRNEAGVLVGYSKITLDLTAHRELEKCVEEKKEVDRILKAARAGTWKLDLASDRVEVSPHFTSVLGSPDSTRVFTVAQWIELIHPEDQEHIKNYLSSSQQVQENPRPAFGSQIRLRMDDGSYRWFYASGDWSRADDNGPWFLTGVNVDSHDLISAEEDRRRLLDRLHEHNKLASVTLSAIADGVITTGIDELVTNMNPAAERLTGWKADNAKGRPVGEVLRVLEGTSLNEARNLAKQCLAEGKIVFGSANDILINGEGHQYSIESSAAPIQLGNGRPMGAVIILHDVTESRKLLHELNYQATHDALTGLVNRTEFELRLRRSLDRAKPLAGTESVLLYMDLDQFKIVNDTCGHVEGDELLRQLAQVYRTQTRERDTLARVGGDEFALIVENCSLEEAVTVATKILETTRRFRFPCKNQVFQIGVSIGLIPVSRDSATVEQLLREADHACYLAKESGRNQIYVQQTGDVDIAQRRSDMQWVRRIEDAFRRNRFALYYQPIVPIRTIGSGLHYEILLRLIDEPNQPIGPDSFLPAAERYDVMPAVDKWVLHKSLEWLENNPEHVRLLERCTINLSRRTLVDESFQKYANALFDRTTVPAHKICFEITENGAIANMGKTISFIAKLAQRGCKFSLDDFGTGMTSFTYLKDLPVDFIKIDGSFIQRMESSPVDYEMVRFTNDISHMMGRKTVAEHVTSEAILQNLHDIKVDYAQGYWLGEPRPLGE
jgi:diguanylate cyclase (GGDEF)-like protein/PAS domain S-box-containing protein